MMLANWTGLDSHANVNYVALGKSKAGCPSKSPPRELNEPVKGAKEGRPPAGHNSIMRGLVNTTPYQQPSIAGTGAKSTAPTTIRLFMQAKLNAAIDVVWTSVDSQLLFSRRQFLLTLDSA
ncbi:hypothetical protein J3E69DRAFT_341927 [Trichoderma sp. SZMC 28015]